MKYIPVAILALLAAWPPLKADPPPLTPDAATERDRPGRVEHSPEAEVEEFPTPAVFAGLLFAIALIGALLAAALGLALLAFTLAGIALVAIVFGTASVSALVGYKTGSGARGLRYFLYTAAILFGALSGSVVGAAINYYFSQPVTLAGAGGLGAAVGAVSGWSVIRLGVLAVQKFLR